MKRIHTTEGGATTLYPDDSPLSPSGHFLSINELYLGPQATKPMIHLVLMHSGGYMGDYLTTEDARAIGRALIDKADQLDQQQAAAHDTEYASAEPDRYTEEDAEEYDPEPKPERPIVGPAEEE